ncbi:hypothetical protein QBC37DRAFT_425197 [Rhypophila decipiens]|uniref:F-box domain-containing protein n=1 Tax=Rhypophila decipiens TaxID=261697 RepID=A0AAN7B8T4_9PEZI|nr:hypothetical protein QBC37DRAFT_425197 [Rhypophila decipiens]
MDRHRGVYTPHSLSDLTAGMTAYLEEEHGNLKPKEKCLVMLDPDSAISHPDQLLGILCLEKWPRSLQIIAAQRATPINKGTDETQAPEMIELTAENFQLLTERAIVEDGPTVVLGGQHLRSVKVLNLKPGAYPPRLLNHAQTCDFSDCRISSIPSSNESPSRSQSDAQAQTTATAAVLKCPELLELILLHLDLKSRITSAPRVSRFWFVNLNQSPSLRKASFFQADRSLDPPEPGERPYINPLLQEALGEYFFNLSDSEAEGGKHRFRRAECFWKLPWSPNNLHHLKAETGSVVDVDPSCRQRSFTRKGASWRRMLVSQPPPPFLGFTWLDCFPMIGGAGGNRFHVDSVQPPTTDAAATENVVAGGVTMGLLYDTVQSLTMHQKQPGLFYRVRWDMTVERTPKDGQSGDSKSTNLVVQFWDDPYFNSKNYGPFSMEATQRAFTCEEAVKPACRGEAQLCRIQGLADDADHPAPGNDEFEIWEPLEWNF